MRACVCVCVCVRVCVTMHTAVFCLILKVFSSHFRLSHSLSTDLMNSSTFMCIERHTFYTLCHKCEVYKWYFFDPFKWIYYIHVYEKMDDFGCYYHRTDHWWSNNYVVGRMYGINLIVCVWKHIILFLHRPSDRFIISRECNSH